MANQHLNFKKVGGDLDTGEKDPASIRPVNDNEDATEAVFRRPSENLRTRSEVLRDAVESLLYLSDADRAYLVQGGGFVTWAGATTDDTTLGTFTITSNLVLRPFLTTAISTPAKVEHNDVVVRTILVPVGDVNPPRAYSGANKITLGVTGAAGASLALVKDGTPTDNLHLTVNNDALNGHTLQQVIDFLNAQVAFTETGLVAELAVGADANAVWGVAFTSSETTLSLAGAVDAETHLLTAAGLAAFFTQTGNRLREGDTLCVWYDDLVVDGYGGRRQSMSELPEDSASIDNNLFILRNAPERQALAIPFATVADGKLVFINGDRLDAQIAVQLGGQGNKLPFELVRDANTNDAFRFSSTGTNRLTLERKDVTGVYDGDAAEFSVGANGTLHAGLTGKVVVEGRVELGTAGTQGAITLKADSQPNIIVTKAQFQDVFGGDNANGQHFHTAVDTPVNFYKPIPVSGADIDAQEVETALHGIVDLYSGNDGSGQIGALAKAGSPTALAAGSVSTQIGSLLSAVNAFSLATGAANVGNAPSGNVTATTVQSAINELDTEKAGKATANTFTEANTFQKGVTATQAVANQRGGTFTGNGSGEGVRGDGASDPNFGSGSSSTAGGPGGAFHGGDGFNGGVGVSGIGGDGGPGGSPTDGAGGSGVVGTGGYAGSTDRPGHGVVGTGGGALVLGGKGVSGTGGPGIADGGPANGGPGVYGIGGAGAGGGKDGPGVHAVTTGSGPALYVESSGTNGPGIRLSVRTSYPSAANTMLGDIVLYNDGSTTKLYACTQVTPSILWTPLT